MRCRWRGGTSLACTQQHVRRGSYTARLTLALARRCPPHSYRDLSRAGGRESWARSDASVDTRMLQVYLSSLATDAAVSPPPPAPAPFARKPGPRYGIDGRRVRLTPAQKAAAAERRRRRRELARLRRREAAALRVQAVIRGFLGRRSVAWLRHHIAAFAAAMATRIQNMWRAKVARECLVHARIHRHREQACTKMQKVVRGRRGRVRARRVRHERDVLHNYSALVIQCMARQSSARGYVPVPPPVVLPPPLSLPDEPPR